MESILNSCREVLPVARAAMRALRKDITQASRHLPRLQRPRRSIACTGGVSSTWLRGNAIESAKHFDDS